MYITNLFGDFLAFVYNIPYRRARALPSVKCAREQRYLTYIFCFIESDTRDQKKYTHMTRFLMSFQTEESDALLMYDN